MWCCFFTCSSPVCSSCKVKLSTAPAERTADCTWFTEEVCPVFLANRWKALPSMEKGERWKTDKDKERWLSSRLFQLTLFAPYFISVFVCTGEAVEFVWSRTGTANRAGGNSQSRSGQGGAGRLPPDLLRFAGYWCQQVPACLGRQSPGCTASR